jgi:hypothetical protein
MSGTSTKERRKTKPDKNNFNCCQLRKNTFSHIFHRPAAVHRVRKKFFYLINFITQFFSFK